jgi:pimeloyl-ACP methyl ester carboxylesterase
MDMETSVFKTDAGRDKIRTYYDRVLSRFPFGQRYVKTAYGQTFMLTAGQEENPPVILLHGSCSNSAFWFPEIMALSGQFMVYAVDIIGEAGNSCEFRPSLILTLLRSG